MNAYEIIMNDRKELVDKIIDMMQHGDFFHNASEWDRDAMRPQNPLSMVRYKGGNRMRLMAHVVAHGYTDPRWATARQYAQQGYHVRKGEHGVICEKWIFEKQVRTTDADGAESYETVELRQPKVSYFRVFNAQQIEGFPELPKDHAGHEPDTDILADRIIRSSRCPVKELAQERAYYSPALDHIILPLRGCFKDGTSFLKTLIHECCHSTAAPSALNRVIKGSFGSEDYAKEELRAEIGALFTETDLGISLKGEHYEDHSDYLRSWISVLQNDYNEFFRACSDAEKIADYLVRNYRKVELNDDIPS